jgi:hypothetical protein
MAKYDGDEDCGNCDKSFHTEQALRYHKRNNCTGE